MNASNPRAVAADIVARWLKSGDFPDRLVERILENRAFVTEVVYGTVKWKRMLEWIVLHYARHPPDTTVMAYLIVGLYQLLIMDHVPSYAAVNETVQALKTYGGGASNPAVAGFVNGILRRVLRERENVRQQLAQQELAVRLSHPDALISRWTRRLGEQRTLKLCEWNNGRPDLVLRPNRALTDVPAFIKRLADHGIQTEPHPFAPTECVVLQRNTPPGDGEATEKRHGIDALPVYDEGLFTVQDPSTLAAVRLLDPQPGEHVLDACAAPGGKTSLIAERMQGSGRLVALDMHTDRYARLRENLRRMRHDWVAAHVGNALDPLALERAAQNHPFDKVLLDVPCTNTGVLQRRPDARWRFSPRRLEKLVSLQTSLLDAVTPFVAVGGSLVYSTCSLEREEGKGLMQAWLDRHPAFSLVESRTLFPPETHTDGAFACLVTRLREDRPA